MIDSAAFLARFLIANPVVAGVLVVLGGGYLVYRYLRRDQVAEPSAMRDAVSDSERVPTKSSASTTASSSAPARAQAVPFQATGAPTIGAIAPKNPEKTIERVQNWRTVLNLDEKETRYGLPRGILTALIAQESGGRADATSGAGAAGLAQFMPKTAKEYGIDPMDPAASMEAAAKKLAGLLRRYNGDITLALAAYNWGEGNIARKGIEAAPRETREYAPRIMGYLDILEGRAPMQTAAKKIGLPPSFVPSASLVLPTDGVLTSGFGARSGPETSEGTGSKDHRGVDIANEAGTAIVAAAAGIVTFAGPRSGYGTLIQIDHGTTQTVYGHSRKLLVRRGDMVAQGQAIAEMGSLGRSTGPHLHFEVISADRPVNPATVLPDFPTQNRAPVGAGRTVTPTAQNQDYVRRGRNLVAIGN